MAKTPDEILAENIVEKLRSKGVLDNSELEKLSKLYASGEITTEEWILRVESSLKKENKDGK
jgi:hypothetical protein